MVMNNKQGSVVRPGNGGLNMKKWWWATPLVVALLLVTAVPSYAWRGHHGGSRVFVGVGVGPWWGYPYPYWYYPPPPYYVYSSPTVVVQQPPVYVEQQPAAVAVPPASASQQQYWYYCQPSGAYYPNVQTCTEPWVKVPARSQ
jgi:hypothetical protein